jgi:hypothetical protein
MAGFGIPKAFQSTGLSGEPIFFDGEITSVPGSEINIFTVVVGVGVQINLTQLAGSGQFDGIFRAFLDGVQIGSDWVRPGKSGISFSWFPARPILEGETVTVTFEQITATPAIKVQAYLMATEET